MLNLALISVVAALGAGALGFSQITGRTAWFFKALFALLLAVSATLAALGLLTGEALF